MENGTINISYQEISPEGLIRHEWFWTPLKKELIHSYGVCTDTYIGQPAVDMFKKEFGYAKKKTAKQC